MDVLVDSVESIPESLIYGGDPVQLGVVRTHHGAIVADQFFTRVTEVSQRLFMKKAEFLSIEPRSTLSGIEIPSHSHSEPTTNHGWLLHTPNRHSLIEFYIFNIQAYLRLGGIKVLLLLTLG